MTLTYTLTFLSDWHCGSGLSGGAEADAIVIKDASNLPYVPGKTIKGLISDALHEIKELSTIVPDTAISTLLTTSESKPAAFFSNAELSAEEKEDIGEGLSHFFYRNIASTQIESTTGTAKPHSLRVKEVTIPVTLTGTVSGVNSEELKVLEMAFKWIRCLGVNRNRGLGRCKFVITSTTQQNGETI